MPHIFASLLPVSFFRYVGSHLLIYYFSISVGSGILSSSLTIGAAGPGWFLLLRGIEHERSKGFPVVDRFLCLLPGVFSS
jgi:hypothetical protein